MQRGNPNPTNTRTKNEKLLERRTMKRMAHNITFRDIVELRLQRIFEEWEDWPDRPVPPKPYIPPTGTLPNTRKYLMDCFLFKGVQIGLLVEKGYKRAYVKARIKELKEIQTKERDSKFKITQFGDYVRIEVAKYYNDPETGERMQR